MFDIIFHFFIKSYIRKVIGLLKTIVFSIILFLRKIMKIIILNGKSYMMIF